MEKLFIKHIDWEIWLSHVFSYQMISNLGLWESLYRDEGSWETRYGFESWSRKGSSKGHKVRNLSEFLDLNLKISFWIKTRFLVDFMELNFIQNSSTLYDFIMKLFFFVIWVDFSYKKKSDFLDSGDHFVQILSRKFNGFGGLHTDLLETRRVFLK